MTQKLENMQIKDWLVGLMRNRQRPLRNADIYRLVETSAKGKRIRLSPHWRATVRNTLQRHAKGNRKCVAKPLFKHKAKGLWEAVQK